MPRVCEVCGSRRAALRRPKTGGCVCRPCFLSTMEDEVHHTICSARLFRPGDTVALGASGGKDSTVLAHMLKLLNDRHGYGLRLLLLSVDEGIAGYRDDSLATVKRNAVSYDLPLTIVSYDDIYGWTMDKVVRQVGPKGSCTYCGVLRRQALELGARRLGADVVATGHNADDVAETAIMNVLRGDGARLARCCGARTSSHGDGAIPRCKPLMYCYEKEIVLYAYFKKLDYFSTECIYSPGAYRGRARSLLKSLERVRPRSIIDVVHSAQRLHLLLGGPVTRPLPSLSACTRCGMCASGEVCTACRLLDGLRKGMAKVALVVGEGDFGVGVGGGGGGGGPAVSALADGPGDPSSNPAHGHLHQ